MKKKSIPTFIFLNTILFFLLVNSVHAQEIWRSQLYPENWQPLDKGGAPDSEGRFLHDFSYAGYAMGEQDIPTVVGSVNIDVTQAPYLADNTGSQDVTATIQAAINDAIAQGGGTVYLPSGTYKLTTAGTNKYCLRISGSNVLLKGDGPGNTFLFADQEEMRQKTILLASEYEATKGDSWFGNEQNVIPFTSDIDTPTNTIELQNVNGLSVGDWIMLRADMTNAWTDEHGMLAEWGGLNSVYKGVSYYRQIKSIDSGTNKIVIDIPTRYTMKVRDNARIYKLVQTHISNVGFTGFSIGQRQKTGSNFPAGGYNNPNTDVYDIHQAFVIAFNHVVDGWLTNVETYRPSVNSSNYHIPSNGVMIHQSRNVTVANNKFSKPQFKGGGGNGNSYMVRGSDNLLLNNLSDDSRHGFNGTDMWCSGNVYKDCEMINGDLTADFHRNFTHANLVENFKGNKGFSGVYRPFGTNVHGHTAAQSVFWRLNSVNNSRARSQQWGWGYVIGADLTSILNPTKGDTIRDFQEGTGMRSSLRPISLYEDQLTKRLNTNNNMLTDDAFVQGGTDSNQNYGTDARLPVKDNSNANFDRQSFLRFDVSEYNTDVTEANLLLHVDFLGNEGNNDRPVELRIVTDENWNEETITWNDKPLHGNIIHSFIVDSNDLNQTISLNVTNYVNQNINDNGIVSFALVQPTNANALVAFSSKEGTIAPQLQIIPGNVINYPIINSVSDQQQGNEAIKLIDGISNTDSNRWSANGMPQSVIIDYGEEQEIIGTELWTYQNRAYQYTVELSNDLDFTGGLVVDRTANTSQTQPITDNFPVVSARYAKLTVNGANGYSGSWVSLREFSLITNTSVPLKAVLTFDDSAVSKEEKELNSEPKFFLHNNPASTILNFSFISDSAQKMKINWFDLSGRNVNQQTLELSKGNNILSLPTNSYPSGLYLVRFSAGEFVIQHKVLVRTD